MSESTPEVLIIDDEEALCSAIQEVLEHAGIAALATTSAREGMQLFAESADQISVVLLDLIMPEMRGEKVLGELLEIKPDVRVILMSAFLGTSEASQFADLGFCGFLPKPFDPSDLITMVRQTMEQR